MGKRWLAMLLTVVMLFDSNIAQAFASAKQGTKAVQEVSQEQKETDSDATQEEKQNGKDDGLTDENTTDANSCKIQFFDENGNAIGKAIDVERGSNADLSVLGQYYVQGYRIAWMNQKDSLMMNDQIVVQEDLNLQAILTPITYYISYDKNADDAEGSMQQQDMIYGTEKLESCGYKRPGYEFAGWSLSAQGEKMFEDEQTVDGINLVQNEGDTLHLYAVWSRPAYTITYHLEDGKNHAQNPLGYSETSETISLMAPTRAGYSFEGWYLDAEYQQPIAEIKTGSSGNLDLYAKWKLKVYTITYTANGGQLASEIMTSYSIKPDADISLPKPTREGYTFDGWCTDKTLKKDPIKKIKKGTTGNLKLYAKWSAKKYEIKYALNGGTNHKKNPETYTIEEKVTFCSPSRKGYYFLGWYTDKECKKVTKSISKGTTGKQKVYAKWEKEYPAAADSAKITTCKAAKQNIVLVRATVKHRIASSNNKYYLVITSKKGDKARHVAASCEKQNALTFKLNTKENRGFALARYAIAVKQGKEYKLISNTTSYISNASTLAENRASYKFGKTKKGLQTVQFSDIVSTGAHNMFMNVNVSSVVNPYTTEPETYVYNGKTYTFAGMGGYLPILRAANARNVNVTIQINLDELTLQYAPQLIASEARQGGHLYYTWEVQNNAYREYMEAIFCFLAEKFGQEDCYVSNWILGNEVNSCDVWCYRGSQSDSRFVSCYAFAFRCLYNAVKSVKSSAKIYTCVDGIWHRKKSETCGMTAQSFLNRFAKYVKNIQKDVYWNVAVHPYSVRIDYPEFWDPISYYRRADLVQKNENTGYITMKNLSVFTKYVKKTFGNKSVIISEIGFDSRRSTQNQAAALAYAYNVAACNQMVDAFIIRSFVDEAGDAGFCFGISGRESYSVFKYMDTKYAEKYTKPYLGVIGKKSWKKLVPGYSKAKLIKNWRS